MTMEAVIILVRQGRASCVPENHVIFHSEQNGISERNDECRARF